MSADPAFTDIVQNGSLNTDSSQDFTVKVDVTGLQPGTKYYYRFKSLDQFSPIGQTKTLSIESIENVNFGIVSCSNYEFGYFNAYNGLVNEDLDAILHLGDYIYEYQSGKYGDPTFVRKHLPDKEIITLQDYRTRYAQYRLDRGLQKAHQMHPFIMIWDDHEIANNAYKTGAQNHQPGEGDFLERKATARQAYYEWQPIRDNEASHHYRSFTFGDLVQLIMLDERYEGREAPTEEISEADKRRSMLGQEQLEWFQSELKNTTSTWKVIGNQVIFAPCDFSQRRPNSPINLDAWDGYAYERDRIVDFLSQEQISNTLFVTGDTHSSWAFDIPVDITTYSTTGASVGVEIGTTSITSANWNEGNEDEAVIMAEKALMQSNPHLKYVEGRSHGYTIVRLGTDKAVAEWYYSSDIKKETAEMVRAKEVIIKDNRIQVE